MKPITAIVLLSFAALAACNKPAEQNSQSAAPAQVADQSAAATPAADAAPQPAMVTTTAIVITNSGATNLIGWRITIGTNGEASYVSGEGSGSATLPADLFAKLRGDIDAAKPLAKLPQEQPCVKPMSFGTSIFVAVGGDRSPDLSCPNNDAGQAIKDDVDQIVTFLKIRNVPRSEGKELPPQNQ
ncbi:MAG: hypothetical protein GC190_17295 [Alphaproteobacteria bacterium]|nr:hypothetical protein [Alphaproteobacteria bacterium]